MGKSAALLVSLAAACGAALITLWLRFAVPPDAVPPLTFSPPKIELGTLFVREPKDFSVHVRNTSGVPIDFQPVRASCSCADVRLSSIHVEPGEETILTGTYQGKGKPGPIGQSVHLVIAEPRNLGFRIPILGEAKSYIQLEPAPLVVEPDFLSAAAATAARAVIRNAFARIGAVVRTQERVQPSFCETQSPIASARAEAEFIVEAANSLVVPTDEELSLECSHSVEKMLVLPLQVRPKGGIRVDPSSVSFGVVRKAELLSRVVTISLEGDLLNEADVRGVCSPEYLVLQSISNGSPSKRDLVFHVRDTFRGAALGGALVIPFRHRGSTRVFSVEVPVSGFLSDDPGKPLAEFRQPVPLDVSQRR